MTFRYAGFWLRLIASLIDMGILWLACWIIELPLPLDSNGLALQIIDTFLYMTFAAIYFGWGQFKYQTTLGKKLLKLYVVRADNGLPMTLQQSLLRCLGYIVSYLPLGTGYLMVAFHPKKQGLHDLMAGSIVVREVRSS
jgi:uncharacterized RDD family membrane protein YckC